jgi:hypothetical protein
LPIGTARPILRRSALRAAGLPGPIRPAARAAGRRDD